MTGRSEEDTASQDHEPATRSALDGAPIFIVRGATGEYSDRREWVVCAFRLEAEARAYVELLSTERQKLGPETFDWKKREENEAAMQAFDPRYSEGYSGTRWYIEEAPLISSATPAVGD